MKTITVLEMNYREVKALVKEHFGVEVDVLANEYNIHNDTYLMVYPEMGITWKEGEPPKVDGDASLARCLAALSEVGAITVTGDQVLVEIMW